MGFNQLIFRCFKFKDGKKRRFALMIHPHLPPCTEYRLYQTSSHSCYPVQAGGKKKQNDTGCPNKHDTGCPNKHDTRCPIKHDTGCPNKHGS